MTKSDKGGKIALLLPPKVPVQTNIGPLFVRHITAGDFKALAPVVDGELSALGRRLLTTSVGRIEDPKDQSAISDEEIDQLQQDDLDKVIAAICNLNGFQPGVGETAFERLGAGLRAFLKDAFRPLEEMAERARKSFADAFKGLGSLSPATKSSLVGDLSSIAKLTQEIQATNLKLEGAAPRVVVSPAIRETADIDLRETPIGRAANAAEDTAEQLRVVASMTKGMAEQIGKLTQNIVGHALPEWMRKLEEDRGNTESNLKHAAQSLSWTKWAISASVVLGLLSLGADYIYNNANDRQQERTEELLRIQVESMKRIQVQQAQEVEILKQVLAESLASKAASVNAQKKNVKAASINKHKR